MVGMMLSIFEILQPVPYAQFTINQKTYTHYDLSLFEFGI